MLATAGYIYIYKKNERCTLVLGFEPTHPPSGSITHRERHGRFRFRTLLVGNSLRHAFPAKVDPRGHKTIGLSTCCGNSGDGPPTNGKTKISAAHRFLIQGGSQKVKTCPFLL